MRFEHPEWLLGLVGVWIFYILFRFELRRREKNFEKVITRDLWGDVVPSIHFSARKGKLFLEMMAWSFILLALARPQWGEKEETVPTTGMDLVIALDVSNSMEVEDVVPSRLKKAKHVVRSLMKDLKGDRVGMVAFAASSFLASPLTNDFNYLNELLEILGPQSIQNQGTDLGVALETAANALKRGAEELQKEDEKGSRAVILISDGEDLEATALEGVEKIKEVGARLYVLGVGTEEGKPVPIRDQNGDIRGYKRDRSNEVVISRFSQKALEALADKAGGKYWTVTPGESEVNEILEDLGALERTEYAERKFVIRTERYQIPLALAVIFLLAELFWLARKRRVEGVALVVAGFLFFAPYSQAEELGTVLDNQKGVEAYQNGQLSEARKYFGSAQAKEPSSSTLRFNQGVIQLKEGNLEGAIEGFGEAASQGDPKISGKSYYNLGTAYAQKGDSEEAIRAYSKAIESARKQGDAQLETDSRDRIRVLSQQQQKQKQQQKQDQDQSKQNPKDQKSDQNDKNQKPKDENKNKPKPGESEEKGKNQPPPKYSQRKFKSEKLSPEDANRVMAEISNRERQLQGKLKKKQGEKTSGGKDW